MCSAIAYVRFGPEADIRSCDYFSFWRAVRSLSGPTTLSSKILLAMRVGNFPDLVPILIENQFKITWRGKPDTTFKLSLKLPRAPARIPKCDEIFLWTFVIADVLQNRSARCHRDVSVNRDCFRLTIVAAMD